MNYTSWDGEYKASLEKDIFESLIFKDSRKNTIEFDRKYLASAWPNIHWNKDLQNNMLYDLVRKYKKESNYEASYKIDIFNKLVIKDNRGYKLEEGKDIFGNLSTSEEINGVKSTIKRNLRRGLELTHGTNQASLQKDIFNQWIYEDSFGNKVQFGSITWASMMKRYRTDDRVFQVLLDQFFYE